MGEVFDENGAVIHDPNCGVPTGRTWACACNERNGYRTNPPDERRS